MADIHVRALHPDEWKLLRDMRLRALTENPGYYSTALKDAQAAPPAFWQKMINSPDKGLFGLYDAENLIGITGVFPSKDDPTGRTGFMGMSYITPHYRGQGLSEKLYDARLAFALNKTNWERLVISHRAGNISSQRAIIRHGFQKIGEHEILWPDGTYGVEVEYVLDLMTLRDELSNMR